jgi:hypothetical protein
MDKRLRFCSNERAVRPEDTRRPFNDLRSRANDKVEEAEDEEDRRDAEGTATSAALEVEEQQKVEEAIAGALAAQCSLTLSLALCLDHFVVRFPFGSRVNLSGSPVGRTMYRPFQLTTCKEP